jgi:hypothetical protein
MDTRVKPADDAFRSPLRINFQTAYHRLCEPTGRANARPMTGSAKQSIPPRKERMDCFAALLLAMTNTPQRSRGADMRPSFAINVLPSENQRAYGTPGARCTRSLACKIKNTRANSPQIHQFARRSVRNGFNGFLRALPGDRACLPPSPADIASANLTPASGRQDHTTSPSASSAFVKGAIRVHRIPPRVRDDRDTPLCGTERRRI